MRCDASGGGGGGDGGGGDNGSIYEILRDGRSEEAKRSGCSRRCFADGNTIAAHPGYEFGVSRLSDLLLLTTSQLTQKEADHPTAHPTATRDITVRSCQTAPDSHMYVLSVCSLSKPSSSNPRAPRS